MEQLIVSDIEGYFWVDHNRFVACSSDAKKFDRIEDARSVQRMLDERHAEKYVVTCSNAYGEFMRTLRAKIYRIEGDRLVDIAAITKET